MRLNSGHALYVNLGHTAYYSNEHYQESAENKGRNPMCLIFHFQTIVGPISDVANGKIARCTVHWLC